MIKIISVKTDYNKDLNESKNNIIPNTTVGGFPLYCNNFSSQMSPCVEKKCHQKWQCKISPIFQFVSVDF